MKLKILFIKTKRVPGHLYTDTERVGSITLTGKTISKKAKREAGYDDKDELYEISKPNIYGISWVHFSKAGNWSYSIGAVYKNGKVSDFGKTEEVPAHDYIVVSKL